VLLRAAANSCKDMVVDYKRRGISFIATFVTETGVLEENSAYSYLDNGDLKDRSNWRNKSQTLGSARGLAIKGENPLVLGKGPNGES